jgi:hypothetical protein
MGRLAVMAVVALVLVGSWYVKNYMLFGKFTTSTWVGMNLSRNVFHYVTDNDTGNIASIEPFSGISVYRPFISGMYEKKFAGINDRDLLSEFKNNSDTLLNLNHISYIEVSDKYLEVSKRDIKAHPLSYLKNVAQSSIIFFAPATRYPWAEAQARKIKYYDAIYSFNLSEFAEGKQQRRITMTLSALPKLLLYALVLFFLIKEIVRRRGISAMHFFIITTITYVFFVSSLLEHYENMRFRFEIEPLFLLVLGQYIFHYLNREKDPFSEGLHSGDQPLIIPFQNI